jgi:manganese/zinc/iron transport system permease protein
MTDILHDLVFDYTLRTVALGSAALGIVSGALGSFAVLRRQSLVGDAISHAALPGIALAFLLTSSKTPLVLLIGAAIAGWIGTLIVMGIVRATRVKFDSALGLVLSVFFGLGMMLLTYIQRRPDAAQAGLDKYLFGQAATLVVNDVFHMTIVGAIALVILLILWKEIKLLSFDPDYGATIGYPMRALDVLLTTLIVIAIVVGLQTVGVVLMSAMLVAPAAAARQWTDRLGLMVALAALFGAIAGVVGATLSGTTEHLPTGPTIIVVMSVIVGISLLFAPNRGLLSHRIAEYRTRRLLLGDALLADLAELEEQHAGVRHGHSVAVLKAMNPGRASLERTLSQLEERGLVEQLDGGAWVLTKTGHEEAIRSGRHAADFGDAEPITIDRVPAGQGVRA